VTTQAPTQLTALLAVPPGPAQERAWDAFVSAYHRLLLRTARTVAHDHDAVMDAYAHVLEGLREDQCRRLRAYTPDGRTRFTTWLVIVARRLCFDEYRRRYGRERDEGQREAHAQRRRFADLLAEAVDPDQLGVPADQAARLEAGEELGLLEEALASLGAQDRLLLKLRFEDDLAARQIAALLHLPTPFHVYRRLTVVLRALRIALGHRGMQSGPRGPLDE
jgi:RNA polymerase sigma factor (sigma-70 family)